MASDLLATLSVLGFLAVVAYVLVADFVRHRRMMRRWRQEDAAFRTLIEEWRRQERER